MERKAFATEFKVAGDGRTVEGYASTFGNIDAVGDIVVQGAYKRTLQNRGDRIKVLRDHDQPIGVPIRASEDSTGLFTVSRISDTQLGNDTLTLLKDGVLDRMSIGYEPILKEQGQKDGKSVRFLKEIKLYEYSVVTAHSMSSRPARCRLLTWWLSCRKPPYPRPHHWPSTPSAPPTSRTPRTPPRVRQSTA